MGKAVILFNLGGPDKLESVEPFLFNLFNDPAIIRIPSIIRYPLAKFISKRRAPIAKNIYKEIGKTLIWPAEWTHAHTGEVLKGGTKYIVTGWLHFPVKETKEHE